jgi:phage replication-related protein YjqB (UPF0714/DUF867 family)
MSEISIKASEWNLPKCRKPGAMDKFACFADLQGIYREGDHFCRTILNRTGPLLILAPHGGGIELGTSELARAIAGDDHSLYLFEALLPTARESKLLHITSTHFDEPACLELVQRVPNCLALHGCEGTQPVIYVGGRDLEMKNRLVTGLTAKGYPAKLVSRGSLAGMQPQNICNCTSSGAGVQLELSSRLRSMFFRDWHTQSGRRVTTPEFVQFVADLRSVLR